MDGGLTRSQFALLSVRRKGIQISLGIVASTILVVVFTVLVYASLNRIDGALQKDIDALPQRMRRRGRWMQRNRRCGVRATYTLDLGILAIVVGILTAFRTVTEDIRAMALEVWIRRMGQGDLENKVVMKGNDEVTELADSLEELRRRSIRVVRLNLVEKLASDL